MNRIIFYQPDRYTRPGATKADKYFEKHIPCKLHVDTDWSEFLINIKDDYDLVAFHSDLFNDTTVEIIDFIKTIRTMLKFVGSKANVAVCINDKCTQETVAEIKIAGAVGIIPGRKEWDLNTAATAFAACISDSHWPEEIISQLPIASHHNIAVFTPAGIDSTEFSTNSSKVTNYHSISELSDTLSIKPKFISLHIDMFASGITASDFIMMFDTVLLQHNSDHSCSTNARPILAIEFTKESNISKIKEFQKAGINYFIPASNSYGVDFNCSAWQQMVSGVVEYYPKHLISRLPGNEKKQTNPNKVSLTNRQLEIFNLISNRGLTNKQIARVLNITESTVKIHVSAIFKNLCVRNRTQLALTKI